MRDRILIFAVFVFVVVIGFTACGKGKGLSNQALSDRTDTSLVSSTKVDTAKKELSEYVPPEGVNKALFELLKEKFIEALEEAARAPKQTSTPEAPPLDLFVVDNGNNTTTFGWRYTNTGDYDLNGEVGVPDITPIAVNYLQTLEGEFKDLVPFIDGDGSGEVGIPDITPIATNYLNEYSIQAGIFTSEPDPQWSSTMFTTNAYKAVTTSFDWQTSGQPELFVNNDYPQPRFGFVGIRLPNTVIPTDEGLYWFAVKDNNDPPRFFSFERYAVGNPGTPIINSVDPMSGYQGEDATFTVSLTSGEAPFTYSWSFGGGATPNTSTDESPTVALSNTAGPYNASVTVTNEFGSDSLDFTLDVLSQAPNVTDITPISGVTGTDITPVATITGKPPFTDYSWNFGGGATPNTSSAVSPTITLGAMGNYDASLSVTNAFGTDVHDFTLTVNGLPPNITGVSPTSGDMDDEVTISATIEGDGPFTYAWTFNNAASPSTSTQASPTVRLTRFNNTYNCNLAVSSAWGTDSYDFQFTVNYKDLPPFVHSVTPTGGQEGQVISIAAVVTGAAPISYDWNFGGGATPNTSSQVNPTITLGDGGGYPAVLSVSNGLGDYDFNFTLNVTPVGGGWVIEVIESGVITGVGTSLTFLETGEPMIAYVHNLASGNRGLKVAKKGGTGWDKVVVDNGDGGYTGFNPSIALDHNTTGNPVIAYQFQNNGAAEVLYDLYYARWTGSAWQTSLAEGDGSGIHNCGYNIALQYTTSGTGHLGHWRSRGQTTPTEVRSLLWSGSSWSAQTVYTVPMGENSPLTCETTNMVLSNGNPVFAVRVSGETNIKTFWWSGSSWNQVSAGNCRKDASNFTMAVDSAGNIGLAWLDYDSDLADGDLKYVKANGTTWGAQEGVWTGNDDVGAYCSLTFAPDDTPWISFQNSDAKELYIAKKVGTWQTEVVDNGGVGNNNVGRYTCIRFGPDNAPHISYQQYGTSATTALKYASLY